MTRRSTSFPLAGHDPDVEINSKRRVRQVSLIEIGSMGVNVEVNQKEEISENQQHRGKYKEVRYYAVDLSGF